MEKYDIYDDIARRTGGDIYIGVVGPVRTGKSTFISKFMDSFVIPNISDKLQRQIATDEMPQSAAGRGVMTTQPKFIPANSVKVRFKNNTTANVKLVDCVGYMVDGATGHMEDDKPRLIKTPWSKQEMPFEKAAEIGTKKVIDDYSTIGIIITTDGSFGEIPRDSYQQAEERVVNELKEHNKPFVVILNSSNPQNEDCALLAAELEERYGVPVITSDVMNLTADDISVIMEKVLLEFPMSSFNVDLPMWMRALPSDNSYIRSVISGVKEASKEMTKMRDFSVVNTLFDNDENFDGIEVSELKLGEGVPEYRLKPNERLYFKVLSEECGEQIQNDYELMSYIKTFAQSKKKYGKIKDALETAESEGYGVVYPTVDEMNLEQPTLVKQSGKYGVKLKATAPCLHIMKVDVSTEVSPIVGTEKQGEDFVNYIAGKFKDNPAGIWETDMFGKSMQELVGEGLSDKISAMPKDAQNKMRRTLSRMINENRGGMICILL